MVKRIIFILLFEEIKIYSENKITVKHFHPNVDMLLEETISNLI